MKNNEILTLGYEKRSIESFIKILKSAEVKVLVDVRDYPKSRKNGFSKSELTNTFSKNGIKYIHLKELGSPPKIRKKLIKDGNYNYFFKKYKDYLVKQEKTIQNLSIIVKKIKHVYSAMKKISTSATEKL